MSVTRMVMIKCDGALLWADECEIEPGGIRNDLASLPSSVGEARAYARANDWKRTNDGRDLCPACRLAEGGPS